MVDFLSRKAYKRRVVTFSIPWLCRAVTVAILALAGRAADAREFAEGDEAMRLSEPPPAQLIVQPARPEPAATAHRPWVWEAEKKGVKIYLAGCLHLGSALEAACFPAYLPYYERGRALYLEVMPGAFEGRDVGQLVYRRGYVPSRGALASRITPEAWREVRQTLEGDQALLKRISRMQHWLAALTVSQQGYRRAGLDPQFALDQYLTGRALAERKPIGSLEKPKDQLLAMADADREDQERTLMASLANYRQPDFDTTAVRRAWRLGDLAQLQSCFGVDAATRAGDTHFNLLARRNLQWVRKINGLAASGRSTLLVIGVEHLVTRPDGLPELLQREGFRVRRVGESAEPTPPPTMIAAGSLAAKTEAKAAEAGAERAGTLTK